MKKYFIILVLLALAIFISGCIGILTTPGDDSIAQGKGILKIYLTDSSGNYRQNDPETYSEVNITISEIQVHLAGEDEATEGGWVECELIDDWKIEYNIKDLKDTPILLSNEDLKTGRYTQIRLFITNPNILLYESTDADAITLVIPSADQTGIKLIHPFKIIENGITELIIDFDAEKSVVKTDNGGYILKPVIKVTSETFLFGDFPEGLGSVSGSVFYYDSQNILTKIIGASVSLSGGEYIFANTTTTSGEVGLEGTFGLNNVPVGEYTLNVNAVGFDDYSRGIEVEEGVNIVNVELIQVPQP